MRTFFAALAALFLCSPALAQYAVPSGFDSTLGTQQVALAVDGGGDVIVADGFALEVARVVPGTGSRTVISSGGNLSRPVGVVVEGDGDIVVADQGADAIIRVDPGTGAQSVVASGLDGLRGIALEASGDFVVTRTATEWPSQGDPDFEWSASSFGPEVLRVDPDTGSSSVLSSGGSLVLPRGIVVEASGDLLVADSCATRVFNAGAPGNGEQRFDVFGGAVIRIDSSTGEQTVLASTAGDQHPVRWNHYVDNGRSPLWARFTHPFAIALDGSGDALVTDTYSEQVLSADATTGALVQVAFGEFLESPVAAVVVAGGDVIVAEAAGLWPGALIRIDPADGSQTVLWSSP